MSDRLFGFDQSPHVPGTDTVSEPRQDVVLNVLYLSAIAVATLGWFWFIIWAATQWIGS